MPNYSRNDRPTPQVPLTDLSTGIDELAITEQPDLVIPVVTIGSAEHTLSITLDEATALLNVLDEVAKKMAEVSSTQVSSQ